MREINEREKAFEEIVAIFGKESVDNSEYPPVFLSTDEIEKMARDKFPTVPPTVIHYAGIKARVDGPQGYARRYQRWIYSGSPDVTDVNEEAVKNELEGRVHLGLAHAFLEYAWLMTADPSGILPTNRFSDALHLLDAVHYSLAGDTSQVAALVAGFAGDSDISVPKGSSAD